MTAYGFGHSQQGSDTSLPGQLASQVHERTCHSLNEMLKARSMRAVKPRWATSTIVCFRQRAAAISHASSVARLPPRLKSGTCSAQSLSRLTDGPHIVRERRARSGMRRTTAGLRTEAKQSSSDQVFRQSRLHRLHICKHHTLYTEHLMLQAVTPAPWSLRGDAFLLPTLKVSTIKQYDVNPLHGAKHWGLFGAVILVKYPETSVGPYSELIFTSGLHRLGSHIGFHISQIFVDSQASVDGGQANWAVPKKLATFDWQTQGSQQQVKVSLPNANQPFFTASFKQSQFNIPASSAVVPPPLKTILQACDPHASNEQYLSTRVSAAGRLHLLNTIQIQTDRNEVPSHTDLGLWQLGFALTDFGGTFAVPQALSIDAVQHKAK